jgi:hypothetical protein
MNMQQATVSTNPTLQLPVLGNSSSGASLVGNVNEQSFDYLSGGHAILMCLVFAFVMPLEFILRLFIKWIGIRIFFTSVSVLLFISGLVLGFLVSPEYIRVSFTNSPLTNDVFLTDSNRAKSSTVLTKSSASSSSSSSSFTSSYAPSQTARQKRKRLSHHN